MGLLKIARLQRADIASSPPRAILPQHQRRAYGASETRYCIITPFARRDSGGRMGHRRPTITRRFGDALLLQRQSMTARAVTSSVNRDESHNSLFLSNRSSAVASAIGLHLPKNRPTSDCTNGAIHRHRQKTAEERLYMLARGWLAYPVTPVAHATTAEERLYMLTPTASGACARHRCAADAPPAHSGISIRK